MGMKKVIKYIRTRIFCILKKISYSKGLEISTGVRIIKSKNSKLILEKNVKLRKDVFLSIDDGATLEIREGSDIGERSRITVHNYVLLGKNVLTGPNVFITDMDHKYSDINLPIKNQGINSRNKTSIDDGSWIGTNSCILMGSEIGKNCVIGCNSICNSKIENYTVSVGSPCKIVKRFNLREDKWERF